MHKRSQDGIKPASSLHTLFKWFWGLIGVYKHHKLTEPLYKRGMERRYHTCRNAALRSCWRTLVWELFTLLWRGSSTPAWGIKNWRPIISSERKLYKPMKGHQHELQRHRPLVPWSSRGDLISVPNSTLILVKLHTPNQHIHVHTRGTRKRNEKNIFFDNTNCTRHKDNPWTCRLPNEKQWRIEKTWYILLKKTAMKLQNKTRGHQILENMSCYMELPKSTSRSDYIFSCLIIIHIIYCH